jgi:outer membrane lipoprotein-sorting protein
MISVITTRKTTMLRHSLLAACLLSLAVVAASEAATALSAEQIVDKNVAARGGLSAWHAVQTMTVSGKLDAGGKDNHQLAFVMKLKRPNKSRMEVVFNDQTAVQVYDGSQGWKLRPFLNRSEVEPYTAEQVKSAAAQDELDGPLIDYAAKGSKVALVGSDVVEGHAAYKLKLTSRAGVQRNLWIDANTFLELKIDGEPRMLDGRPRKVAVYYRDYQSEHGLTTPRLLETAVEGVKVNHKMQISQVTVNDTLDDALFQKPLAAASAVPAAPVAPAPLKKP